MKKLIVLSVIFALVAGSVFAADVSVDVFGNANLLKGSSEEKADGFSSDGTPLYTTKDYNKSDFGIGRVRISASGALEDGTIGGWLRFDASYGSYVHSLDKTTYEYEEGLSYVKPYGFVWWKPADIFKIQIGQNPDGEFTLEGVAGWGFYQLAGDVGIISNGNTWGGGVLDGLGVKFRNAFFGGYGKSGIIITSNPVEALTINIGFPLGSHDAAFKDYKDFTLQVKYDIDGVGTAAITYENSLFEHLDADGKTVGGGVNNDNPKLYAYFGLTSIENLGIDVGIGYKFSDQYYLDARNEQAGKLVGKEETWTINNPLSVGVGVNFSADALGVKARVLGEFLGSTVYETTTTTATESKSADPLTLGTGLSMLIDVQPSYAVNETLTAYLSLGIGFHTGNEYVEKLNDEGKPVIATDNSSVLGWHIQPYIVITPSYWSGAFFAGIRLESPTGKYSTFDKEGKETKNRILNWSIPIGVTFSF